MENPYQSESSIDPQNDFRREIPTPTFNALAAARLSGAEYQLIFVIIDRSWGWSKSSANISLKHFETATSLSRRSVITAIKSLEKKRIITIDRYKVERERKAQTNEYLFNKFYDTWILGSEEDDTTNGNGGSEANDTTQQQSSEVNDTTQLQSNEVNDTTLDAGEARVVKQMTPSSEVNDTTSSEANDTTSSEPPKAKPGYAKESTKESTKETSKERGTPKNLPQTIITMFQELCPSLPKLRANDKEAMETRKKDIAAICKKVDNPIDYFRELFNKAEASDFLSGRAKPGDGHENWRCNIDWLLKTRNRMRILEGNYDNKGGPYGRGTSGSGEGWEGFTAITDD